MSLPLDTTLYHEVYTLTQQGQFEQVITLLDASPVLVPHTHYRQRAYALHNLYRYAEAHHDMRRAVTHAEGEARGAALVDWAVMHMREQRQEEGFELYHQGLALLERPALRVPTLYNLAWTYLRQLNLRMARMYLQEALRLVRPSRDAQLRWWLTFVRGGLALVARVEGQWTLAQDLAWQAVKSAPDDRAGVFAHNVLASTQRLLGDLERARATQARAVALAGRGYVHGAETFHAELIALQQGRSDGRALAALLPLLSPYDAARGRIHLAQYALRRGAFSEARALLDASVHAEEPYVLLDEAPALAELRAFAGRAGVTIPAPVTPQPPRLHLVTWGMPAVHLNGHALPDIGALGVGILLYLHLKGPARPSDLAAALLDVPGEVQGRDVARIRAALAEIRYWVGSDALIQRHRQRLTLHPAWTVTSDDCVGAGRRLADLYGPWIEELADA
ncbi:tetratricopeptide repeat protein [uncultured Deinococcus sp.]|uniref:tetratricopeptide repeat protein n=1 Tax=uncultured Deinococcus sp. TaxID=158789 RepID=UPI0025D106D0|nr:tetratricopeptide repeat protein [uncultured Deinococcus sp.]